MLIERRVVKGVFLLILMLLIVKDSYPIEIKNIENRHYKKELYYSINFNHSDLLGYDEKKENKLIKFRCSPYNMKVDSEGNVIIKDPFKNIYFLLNKRKKMKTLINNIEFRKLDEKFGLKIWDIDSYGNLLLNKCIYSMKKNKPLFIMNKQYNGYYSNLASPHIISALCVNINETHYPLKFSVNLSRFLHFPFSRFH